jgi:hypothetical protein
MVDTYDFDPEILDRMEDDFEEEEISIDDWKPREKSSIPKLVQSEWRRKLIGNDFNQEPDIDDVKKIKMYIKKKCSDAEIMATFGISADVLIAIKKNRYDPGDGIRADYIDKIYKVLKEQAAINKQTSKALEFISGAIFNTSEQIKAYKEHLKGRQGKKAKKPPQEKGAIGRALC